MANMPDSFTDVAVLVAFLNFAGIAVGAVFSWLASRRAQEAVVSSKANNAKLDTVTNDVHVVKDGVQTVREKVQTVREKVSDVKHQVASVHNNVEKIEIHTNSMQDKLLENVKKVGVQEGKEEVLAKLEKDDNK